MHLISTKVKDSLQISHKHHAECLKIKQLPDLYLFLLFDLIIKFIKIPHNWLLFKIDTHITQPHVSILINSRIQNKKRKSFWNFRFLVRKAISPLDPTACYEWDQLPWLGLNLSGKPIHSSWSLYSGTKRMGHLNEPNVPELRYHESQW